MCEFACQQRVLKTCLGTGYLRSEDEAVWVWHVLVNLLICGFLFDSATAQSQCFMAIARDNGLSTLYHGCWFVCEPMVSTLCHALSCLKYPIADLINRIVLIWTLP